MLIYAKFKNVKNEWLESHSGVLTFTLDFNKAYDIEFNLDDIANVEDIANPIIDIVKKFMLTKEKGLYLEFFRDRKVNKPIVTYSINFTSSKAMAMSLDPTIGSDKFLKDLFYELGNAINSAIVDEIFKSVTASSIDEIFDTLGIPKSHSKVSKDSDEDEIIKYINTKTKATVSKPKETIADYVCNKTLNSELNEICDFFKNEKLYKDKNIILPKGILFKGEPGTGKTYAARCIAGSVECYFMHTTASALQGQYIGSGAQNIKELFSAARMLREKTNKGVIIFIDELDSLGNRLTHGGGAGGEEDRTLNQLLAELSGFEDDEQIMVMAATNFPDRLDDALMRSGRFSRQITIDYPNENERIELVKYYYNKIKMPLKGTNTMEIAFLTEGLSPADIKEIANESAILAVRNKSDDILLEHINEAVNKVITKNIRNEDTDLDLNLVAAHECGHVLAELIYNKTVPIKVTNYSYGNAGGFTQSSKKLDGLITNDDLANKIRILLGGRAAELVMYDKITTGASNDLYKAKNIIKNYYETYMFNKYEYKDIDQLVINDIFKYYSEVIEVFKQNKDKLETLTNTLIKNRVMYKSDILGTYTKLGGIL